MKKKSSARVLLSVAAALGLILNLGSSARAQAAESKNETKSEVTKSGAPARKPLPADPEERFKMLFSKARLSGRWAPLKDGELGEEHTGDKYEIVSALKGNDDNWTINARMKYRGQDMVMPVPVKMKFSGDTAILIVDNLSIPGGGTYTARLLIYERTYSGTWNSPRGGGMLYGTITNEQ